MYSLLEVTRNEVRLLEISPATKLTCRVVARLRTVSLDELPVYNALSWCWGDATEQECIEVDGQLLPYSSNLEVALRHLRSTDDIIVVWIDAICINQQDLMEKGKQIAMMGRIYKQAATVQVWLGEAVEGSDGAMQLLEHIQKCRTVKELADYDHQYITRSRILHFTKLLQRPWWTRVWVMQEIVLAQHAIIVCVHASSELRWTTEAVSTLSADIQLNSLSFPTDSGERDYDHETAILLINSLLGISQYFDILDHTKNTRLVASLMMLSALSAANVTDDRDKVYGAFGIMSEEVTKHIPVDYTLPAEGVYVATTCVMITVLKCLRPLGQIRSRSIQSDHDTYQVGEESRASYLPTWSLDFRQNINGLTILFSHFSATHSWGSEFSTAFDLPLLEVQGTLFDEIVFCYDVVPEVKTYNTRWLRPDRMRMFDRLWRSKFGLEAYRTGDTAYVGGGTMEEAYWFTIARGLLNTNGAYGETRRLRRSDWKPYAKWLRNPASQRLDSDSLDWDISQHAQPYHMTIRGATRRSACLFKTRRGYMGMSVEGSEIAVGDLVYLLHRAEVPFVLRTMPSSKRSVVLTPAQLNRQDTVFEVVAQCYVHGIMDSEAFSPTPHEGSTRFLQHELRRKLFGGPALDATLPVKDFEVVALA